MPPPDHPGPPPKFHGCRDILGDGTTTVGNSGHQARVELNGL
jgi:hypothetical protein